MEDDRVWVCMVCGRSNSERYGLKDLSCIVRAKLFKTAGITFSDHDPGYATDVDFAYLVDDESDQ